MGKKVLFLVLGFGMITAGIAGITTSVIDQKNRVVLDEIERIKEETRTAAAEEQKKLDEKQQEIDRLAMIVEENSARLEEEDRRREERKNRETAIEQQKRAATEPKTPAPKAHLQRKENESMKKQTVLLKNKEESRKVSSQGGVPPQQSTTRASKLAMRDNDIKRISRKAGLEAARLFTPVKYYNRKTREVILAEPFDSGPNSVRVRVRIWRKEKLANDMVVSFPGASLREQRRYRGMSEQHVQEGLGRQKQA